MMFVLLFCICAAEPDAKELSKLPPWQRMLQGADAARAEGLQARIDSLWNEDKVAEWLMPARDLADLRERVQGADHWQARDARRLAADLERFANLPADARHHLVQAAANNQHGFAFYQQGRYRQAQPVFEEALALRRKVLGEEHPYIARSYNNVAANLNAQGKYAEAAEGYQKALAIRKKVLGDEHPDTATSYNNFAANLQALGKYSTAAEGYQKALAIRRKILGEEHADTATSYNNVAANQQDQGKYTEAAEGFQKALAIRLRVLGEEHPDTAVSYNNVALNLNAQGKYTEAAAGFQKALAIKIRVLGEEHPTTATSYNNVASNLQDQGKYAEAAESYQKALAICIKVLGEEHPDTAGSYNNVALNLNAQGKYTEAGEGFQKALAIRLRVLSEEHPDTAGSYNNVAGNLRDQGKFTEAAEGFQKALAISLRVLGEGHPDTATTYNNIAGNLQAQGKYAEAAEGYQRALAIFLKVLGDEHPLTATSYDGVAVSLQVQGKYTEAAEGFQKALAIRLKVLGEEHPDTAGSYNDVAFNLSAQGKYAEADKGLQKALTIRRKVLGDEHLHTAQSYNNIAGNLRAQGKYAEAAKSYQKALAICIKVLGEEHPDTAGSYNNVACMLQEQGKYADAERMAAEAAAIGERLRANLARGGAERSIASSQFGNPTLLLSALQALRSDASEAFTSIERWFGRGLLDDLAARQRAVAPEDRAQRQQVVARIEALERLLEQRRSATQAPEGTKEIDRLTQEVTGARASLASLHRQWDEKYGVAAGRPLSLGEIQAALPEASALVAWIDLDDMPNQTDPTVNHWALLLRKRGAPVAVKLAGKAWSLEETELAARLLQEVGESSMDGAWQETARLLEKQRIEPLLAHLGARDGLPAVRNLIILPSPVLAGVPIELVAPQGVIVSYAPSGSLLAMVRQKSKPTGALEILAVGDPQFGDASTIRRPALAIRSEVFNPLPGTRAEVEQIREHVAGAKGSATVWLGAAADERALAQLAADGGLKRYRYLHFATHGVVNHDRPLLSSIVLSQVGLPDPARQLEQGLPVWDGRVSVQEIVEQWELNADLVVLSACETALGRRAGGEGFIGFVQALTLAGARSIVLSLWKVDDAATALLMDRFYANLLGQRAGLSGSMKKSEALAEAKAWLRDLPRKDAEAQLSRISSNAARAAGRIERPGKAEAPKVPSADRPFEHPYYWAAFVLYGDFE